ncbi:MAG TPA: papain-like cysteine protease family protein [Candidatus Eremiobacteraeota bacterium]|nr:papain-like cysteine protease family protein [Candidatus Eremiobacteraeota bacterium]
MYIKYNIIYYKYILIFILSVIFTVKAAENSFPESHIIYGVPYESQPPGSSYCGEATLYMIIHYWDEESTVTQTDLVRDVFSSFFNATFPFSIENYLNSRGFNIITHKVQNLTKIKEYICQDIPVLVVNSMTGMDNYGHFRVVIGYDDNKGEMICHDPALGNNYIMKYEEFLATWDFYNYWMMAAYPPNYREILALKLNPLPYPQRTAYMDTKVHMVYGRAYLEGGYYEESLKEFELALSIVADANLKLNLHLFQSEAYIGLQKWDKAEQIILFYGEQIEYIPQFCYLLAKINYVYENYEKGIYYASKAVEIDPYYGKAYIILGKCQKEMDQPELARRSFQKALFLDINLIEAREEIK